MGASFLPHKCRGAGYSNKGIEGPLTDFNDYNNAQATIATLRLLSNSTMNAPFFVACGFHRPCAPHLLFLSRLWDCWNHEPTVADGRLGRLGCKFVFDL